MTRFGDATLVKQCNHPPVTPPSPCHHTEVGKYDAKRGLNFCFSSIFLYVAKVGLKKPDASFQSKVGIVSTRELSIAV